MAIRQWDEDDLMVEDEGQTRSNGASPVADEALRLYLLCRLADDRRLSIDVRLLADNELAERILLIESELSDDYAAGRLKSVDHEAYAKSYLVTDERRRQLRFTQSLQGYARSQTAAPAAAIKLAARPPWREQFVALLGQNWPAWAIAGSLAVLLLLGLAWFSARRLHESTPLVAKQESPVPVVGPQASVPPEPARATATPTPTPGASPNPATAKSLVAGFVLLPGAARGGGELVRVPLPHGAKDVVRLSLVVEVTAADVYQIELTTTEGRTVAVRNNLKIEAGNRVVFAMPARLLHSGDYQIKLSHTNAAGQSEAVARYYFRAL